MNKLRILAISGSTKSTSTVLTILNYIKNVFVDELEVVIYNQIGQLPHFNPELEDECLPMEVMELRKQIENADGVLFCTPEYVFSLPGSLKNAIEWNVSTVLFSNKPVAIIVAAALGEKAFESLSLILTTIESVLSNESKLLIQGLKGKIKDHDIVDPKVKLSIDNVIHSLVKTILDEHRKPTKFEH